jgi:dipeptidyl aminopeptidase/acylaminoacyl peptidase
MGGLNQCFLKYMFNGPPYISPDGSKIMFDASFYPGSLPNKRFVQAISRTGENLFFYPDFSFPQWMPDGRPLMSGQDGLYIGEAKISGQAVLIPNSQNIGNYSVSPDGKRIAFIRRAATGALRHVYMMNIDGTGTRQVTNSKTSGENDVSFSPDGNSLMVTTSGCISVFNRDCPLEVHGHPGLPSFQFMLTQKVKIAPVHSDFGAVFCTTVPDGIC